MPLTKIYLTDGEDVLVKESIQDVGSATELGFAALTLRDGREIRINFAHVISFIAVPENTPQMPPKGVSFGA